MMKRFALMLCVCVLTGILASCSSAGDLDSQGTSPNTTSTAPATPTTVNLGVGGDDWDYSRHYHIDFSIEGSTSALVDEAAYEAWRNTFEHINSEGTRSKYEYNMYTLIREFSIPREEIEKICEDYKKLFPEDEYLTKEQLDMLYNGTELEVYQYFANPHAVMVGKDAYPPKWMVQHTAEDYREVGITYDLLTAKLDDVLEPCTAEQQAYIRTQCESLKD